LKLPEAIETPDTDTGMFAAYGQLVLHGARPYVDFWDVHPPLVFGYWALVESVTGPEWLRTCYTIKGLAPQSCTGSVAHGLDLLLSVTTALFTASIARRAGGSPLVAALAAVLVVGFADQVMLSNQGSNPSKLTLLPSTVAVWAYVRSLASGRGVAWAAMAGLAAAVAGFAKQPALLTLLALVGHAAWSRDRRSVVALLAGSGLVVGCVCVGLAAAGSLDGFVAQAWAYNLQRTFSGYFLHPTKDTQVTLGRVLTEGAGMLAVLGALGGIVLARESRSPRQFVLLWWAALNAVTILAFREFAYVVPSLAILGAFGFDRAWCWIAARGTGIGTVGCSLLLAISLATIPPTTRFQQVQLARARGERGPGGGLSQPEELGRILTRDLPPGSLFVYGNAAMLYPLSGRPPATPYLNAEAFRSTAPAAERTRADLVAMLQRSLPTVIVLAPHHDELELNLGSYQALRSFLQGCYRRRPINRDFDHSWTVLTPTRDCAIARS